MKNILLPVLLLIACLVKAQTINITVNGSPDSIVKIIFPVNGTHYWPNEKTYKLNAKHSVSIPLNMETAANIVVVSNEKRRRVFIEPKQPAAQLIITNDGDKQSAQLIAPNAAGINLVKDLKHPHFQSKAKSYIKKDSSMAAITSMVDHDIAGETHRLDSLLALRQISPVFYRAAVRDIRYYYANVLASIVCQEYNRAFYDEKNPAHKVALNKDMEAAWPGIYQKFPLPDEDAIRSTDFFNYANDYIDSYQIKYTAIKKGTFNPAADTYYQHYDAFVANFTGKVREYLLASYIYDALIQQQYQPQLVQLFNRFKKLYPASNYTALLAPLVQDVVQYQAKAAGRLNANQHLIANTFANIDELLASFKGKTVFVDMWATWCVPCKEEFKFLPALKKYLADNKVDILYISLDRDDADKKWQEMIKYFGLDGSHVRTTPKMYAELINRFGKNQSFSIPRYLIVKDGKIVEDDALRPSDQQKLYDQIGKYL